ncbi:hypothetical protein BHE74_00009828 [Ensete ventricosum]|nr:hypothetical protein GW17_00052341 [Ensete ventricosum]RWW81748.1 hypothetical protein BHE74_00009828 [Ensete ventricosum]RZR93774.1 hypothetical protein BHM03_00022345 [Ensete ventricosum]
MVKCVRPESSSSTTDECTHLTVLAALLCSLLQCTNFTVLVHHYARCSNAFDSLGSIQPLISDRTALPGAPFAFFQHIHAVSTPRGIPSGSATPLSLPVWTPFVPASRGPHNRQRTARPLRVRTDGRLLLMTPKEKIPSVQSLRHSPTSGWPSSPRGRPDLVHHENDGQQTRERLLDVKSGFWDRLSRTPGL